MISVLVYPNITYARNLEADSFVCDLRSILPRLAESRPELEFTLLLPEPVKSLQLPNVVEQLEWPLPSYPNAMRCHFDPALFLELYGWKRRSFDIVYSHLPEQTLAIKNTLYNSSNERPVFVGYSHWVEIPELNTFQVDTFPAWLNGVLEMDYCGVTTEAMKQTVLRRSKPLLSPERQSRLEEIIHPQYLGVEAAPETDEVEPEPGLLIWNHRPHSYTGFPLVIAALDELWKQRQDFRVVVTLADAEISDKPYAAPSGLPAAGTPEYRRAYFQLLARGWAGLPRLVSHWTWPVAIADGMTAGLPYVVPRDFYVPEIFTDDYPWVYGGDTKNAGADLVKAISQALDDYEGRPEARYLSLKAAASTSWDTRITAFEQMFDGAITALPTIGDSSAKYADVRRLAEAGYSKEALLKEMGWGVRIAWTAYRNRLRKDGIAVSSNWYGPHQPQTLLEPGVVPEVEIEWPEQQPETLFT